MAIGQFVLLRYDKCSPLRVVNEKICQETGKKIRESNSCRNPRNWFTTISKSEAYSADVLSQLLAGFTSRRLQQLLHQRYKVTARIFYRTSVVENSRSIVFVSCRGFSYTAEFIVVVSAANCSRAWSCMHF